MRAAAFFIQTGSTVILCSHQFVQAVLPAFHWLHSQQHRHDFCQTGRCDNGIRVFWVNYPAGVQVCKHNVFPVQFRSFSSRGHRWTDGKKDADQQHQGNHSNFFHFGLPFVIWMCYSGNSSSTHEPRLSYYKVSLNCYFFFIIKFLLFSFYYLYYS